MTDVTIQLQSIGDNLAAAEAHMERIRQMMDRIQQEGMYDAVPTESWQDRGGRGVYLYHYFPQNPRGIDHLGPDGKKKVYVGVDKARIAEARRLANNTRRYQSLARSASTLARWLGHRHDDLNNLAAHSPRFPRFDFRSLGD